MTDLDVTASAAAIATALGYPRQIHSAAIAAQGVALGPWHLSVRCNYGSSDKNSYSSDAVCDFSAQRATLQSAMFAAEKQADQFLSSFNFVSTWVATTLPATAASFADASAPVAAAIAASQAGSLTQPQIDAATGALATLLGFLQQSSTDLTDGIRGLAAYSVQVENYAGQIQQVVNGLTTSAQSTIDIIQNSLGSMPCGTGDAQNQLNGFRAQFTTASGQLQSTFNALAGQTRDANNAIGLLLGTVVTFVSSYQGVIGQVRQAQAQTVGSLLEGLRLDIAARQWQTLASDAGTQLGAERRALGADLVAAAAALPQGTGTTRSRGFMTVPSPTARIDKALVRVFGSA